MAEAAPVRATRRPWPGLLGRARPLALYVSPQGFRPFVGGELQAMEALGGWCAAHAGQALHLVVGAGFTQSLLADAALPLPGDDALLEHARLQFLHYHGPAAAQWPLAPWRWGERRGAVALHGLDLGGFAGLRLRSAEPYWSIALRAACRHARPQRPPDDTAYLIVEGPVVTVADCRGGRLEALGRRRLDEASPAALAALVAELRGAAPAAQLFVVVGHGLAGPEVPLRGCAVFSSPMADAPGAEDWLA